MPGKIRLIINGILKITLNVSKAFLMVTAIVIKSKIMIMDEDLHVVFCR